MGATGNVRGFVILSRIDFIRRRWGDEGLGTVIAAGWYGFDLAQRPDEPIASEANRGGAVYRELGAASAEDNLLSTALHALYYDTGRSEYECSWE